MECILGKLLEKATNLVKIGCFSFENGLLMGGKLGKKLVIGLIEKVKFSKSGSLHPRTILVRVPPPPPRGRTLKIWHDFLCNNFSLNSAYRYSNEKSTYRYHSIPNFAKKYNAATYTMSVWEPLPPDLSAHRIKKKNLKIKKIK